MRGVLQGCETRRRNKKERDVLLEALNSAVSEKEKKKKNKSDRMKTKRGGRVPKTIGEKRK